MKYLFLAAPLVLAGGAAFAACTTIEETVAHFQEVNAAYLERVTQMKPEDFQTWTGALEVYGNALGRGDLAGACAALDGAAATLGWPVAAAGGSGKSFWTGK